MAQGSGFNNRHSRNGGWNKELSKEVIWDIASATSWHMKKDTRREEEDEARATRIAQLVLESHRMEAERRQKELVNYLVTIAFALAVGFVFGWHYRGTGF